MRLDPCGRMVTCLADIGSDYVRPFRDRPDIIVRRDWYPCTPNAPPLGFPTAFFSPQNEGWPWLPRDVGTVWPQEWIGTRRRSIQGLDYSHVCGTEEEFARGLVYDPTVNVNRDVDGIPDCCPRLTAPGGPVWDGSAPAKMYCTTYTFTCAGTPITLTMSPLIQDRQWFGISGGVTWVLESPLVTLVAGQWRLRSLPPGITTTFVSAAAWNGRGSRTFTRTSGLFCAIAVSVSCNNPTFWWLNPDPFQK